MAEIENTVELRGDILVLTLRGNQNSANMKKIRQSLTDCIDLLSSAGKPVLAVVDVSQIQSHTMGSRLAASKYLMEMDYDLVAVCGARGLLRKVADLIIQGSGHADTVRQFDDAPTALVWLKKAQIQKLVSS